MKKDHQGLNKYDYLFWVALIFIWEARQTSYQTKTMDSIEQYSSYLLYLKYFITNFNWKLTFITVEFNKLISFKIISMARFGFDIHIIIASNCERWSMEVSWNSISANIITMVN